MLKTLVDAVVSEFNAQDFTLDVTATRHYLPKWKIDDPPALRVKIALGPVDREEADRSRTAYTVQVGIGISKRLTSTAVTEALKEADIKTQADALLAFVEEVADHFDPPCNLADYTAASASEPSQIPAPYEWEELEAKGHFFAVVNVTFEVVA